MALVEEGGVGTIIVKDMSRLGRDYLKVGYYTEVLFPGSDIRFIAINNGVDSANQQDSDFTPFLNIINEWYAKDTSKKIRAVFKAKGQAGKPLCTNPPYGYVKDPEDKMHWVIDEEAADVVRQAFHLCMDGYGPTQIAKEFMKRGYRNPTAHAKDMGYQSAR
jgi:site-specific DNA recombinase